jgi:hypothetical protein
MWHRGTSEYSCMNLDMNLDSGGARRMDNWEKYFHTRV